MRDLDNTNTEIRISNLALLAPLLIEESFINSIEHPSNLNKLITPLLFDENSGVVTNALLC